MNIKRIIPDTILGLVLYVINATKVSLNRALIEPVIFMVGYIVKLVVAEIVSGE